MPEGGHTGVMTPRATSRLTRASRRRSSARDQHEADDTADAQSDSHNAPWWSPRCIDFAAFAALRLSQTSGSTARVRETPRASGAARSPGALRDLVLGELVVLELSVEKAS